MMISFGNFLSPSVVKKTEAIGFILIKGKAMCTSCKNDCEFYEEYDDKVFNPHTQEVEDVVFSSCQENPALVGAEEAPKKCDKFWPIKPLCQYVS